MDNIPNLSQYKYERELSQRIATLEEENEELKEELNKWATPCGLGMMNEEATKLYQELQKENKELKERNKFKCANCKAHHTGCTDPGGRNISAVPKIEAAVVELMAAELLTKLPFGLTQLP